MLKTNYHIHQVLKNPNLDKRIISQSVELSEYNIKYILRRSTKSQSLIDFVAELNSPIDKDPPL